MRRFVFATALVGASLTLAACSSAADDTAATVEADSVAKAAADDATATAAARPVLDANTATAEQLAAARGMTPELAAAIVAGRPYASVTALNAKLLETVEPGEAATVLAGVFVPVDLNTASEADIKLIPGMTSKMVDEFLEYRPYADLGVFDREIGKYVDAAEVARFRNYVTL
jgi:DNA uptake protein ComE-like DNA-binding protein